MQHGPSTLTISLPSQWVRKFNLKKGEDVTIEQLKNGLFLSTGKSPHHEQKRINVKGLPAIITRAIAALYKAGYDEIIVEYDGPDELDRIHQTVSNEHIGFEIVDETRDTVVIKKVSEPSAEEFYIIFRRIFHFIITTADEGLEATRKDDKETYRKLVIRDKNVNKLSNFCRRLVNNRRQTEYDQETALYHLIEQLEKIGDDYKDLNKHLIEQKGKPADSLLALYQQTNNLLREYEELFFRFELKKLNAFFETYEALLRWSQKNPVKDHQAAYFLLNIARELHGLSGVTMILHL